MQTEKGFTLLEILVVMFLLAGLSLIVLVNIPNQSDQSIKQQLDKFSLIVNQVSDTALIKNQTYGIFVAHDNFSIMQLNSNQWQPNTDKSIRRNQNNTNTKIQYRLQSVEGLPYKKHTESLDKQIPQIIFWPDGTITPFEMEALSMDSHYKVSADAIGALTITVAAKK
ncbi:MAG: type II secretion system minor pseudopilin GspH [Gammaproteobacteria bacterium]|nr:type II secretion system minor pseudopilin GspH [Gammaproteobacteria bacterium]